MGVILASMIAAVFSLNHIPNPNLNPYRAIDNDD
jgi:hypothetical protein